MGKDIGLEKPHDLSVDMHIMLEASLLVPMPVLLSYKILPDKWE